MSQPQQQTNVNLDELERQKQEMIDGMHPKVREFWNSHPSLEYVPKAEDRIHRHFIQKTARSKHELKVQAMYRVKKGQFDAQEHLWWFEQDNSEDHLRNRMQRVYVIGRYELPIAQYEYSSSESAGIATGISNYETVYEIQFSKEVLDDLVKKKMITGNTNFYIETPYRVYGDIDFDDFRNLSFEDLLFIGKTGLRPEARIVETRARQKRMSQAEE